MKITRRALPALLAGAAMARSARAAGTYDAGADDKSITLGNMVAYSGPASFYGVIGKVHVAYFQMLNDQGGINGRKVTVLSRDDGYSPPKGVEMVRQLVEQDRVLAVFGVDGTAVNMAIQKYLAGRKVPHLFAYSGAPIFGDRAASPWSVGWIPSYDFEGAALGKYVLANVQQPKVAALFQNDDYGKSIVAGMKRGLGARAAEVLVATQSYEVTDPTVDSQVLSLQGSGANVFAIFGTPKATAQALRKSFDSNWNALKLVTSGNTSVASTMVPAGLDKTVGVVGGKILKEYGDPQWADDAGMKGFVAFLKQYVPGADPNDLLVTLGYSVAQTMAQVLRQCGDELTHENVLKQALNLKNVELSLLLPGIKANTSPTEGFPIRQLQMARFDGKSWQLFGGLIGDS